MIFLVEENVGADHIRKTRPVLPTTVDPDFDVAFDEQKCGAYLREHLPTSHMFPTRDARVIAMIKRCWSVFNPNGLKYSVIGYECNIDTGNAAPVSCGNVNYGPRESKETEKHIAALCQVAHMYEVEHSAWMSKAPSPQTSSRDNL